uniref:Uncharacterized protein n=1 Tax=Physcomitrium patens TaxID=3218 RepID=A0A2K1JZN8_PHYPA|nr:hypothetical protein PHYPA_014114 [Physcomitrium patens]
MYNSKSNMKRYRADAGWEYQLESISKDFNYQLVCGCQHCDRAVILYI